jgi:hypothetical protein
MKRATLVALCTAAVISSATALDIAGPVQTSRPEAGYGGPTHAARTREAARAEQRDRIHARYLAERERCAALKGYQREKCVVKAHANKGRALLEAAAPYEVRFQEPGVTSRATGEVLKARG